MVDGRRLIVREVLRLAAAYHLDSSVVVFALADLLATTAVTLDLHGPALSRCQLNDRIDSFVAQVRARYPEILSEVVARRQAAG